MISKKVQLSQLKSSDRGHASTYSTRYFKETIPRYEIPEKSMPANAAYQLVHDELMMDANPALNLASFVSTWMEPEAISIINENLHKNFVDHDPQTEAIHQRCINMLSRLYNSPKDCISIGTSTTGSSEAIMLALLSYKFKWKQKRKKENKPFNRPNIVFGAAVHVCWEKFAKYFDVEMRMIPLEKDLYTITPKAVEKLIDENTICVGCVLGSTYTGQADPIFEINKLLLKIKKKRKLDIPIHVDAASGGFVVPFTLPRLKWDFRLEQVKSINVSGHKYGLVYPGLGFVIWKDEKDFPEEVIFRVNYLGGWIPTFTLNFSRGSSTLFAQYYNFLRLGEEGYSHIMNNCLENTSYLAKKLSKTGKFNLIEDTVIPVVALTLKDESKFSLFDLSHKLREYGWVVPSYKMPLNANVTIMRIVIREHFSRDMIEIFFRHIMQSLKGLEEKTKN